MILELERTYLAKHLPDELADATSKEIRDRYVPERSDHSKLRIRKNGEKLEITKKALVDGDRSVQTEATIPLSPEEYEALCLVPAKEVRKIRHSFKTADGVSCEVDVFQGDLLGLVLVDFEFASVEAMRAFVAPDFCLAEVTEEEFVAGWALCGKSYADIAPDLERFGYVRIG